MMGKPEEQLVTMTSMGYSTRSNKIAPEKVFSSSPRLKLRPYPINSSDSKGESCNSSEKDEHKCRKSEYQEDFRKSSKKVVKQFSFDECHREIDTNGKHAIIEKQRHSPCFARVNRNKSECHNDEETNSEDVFKQLSFEENQLKIACKCDDTKRINGSSFKKDMFCDELGSLEQRATSL